MHEIIIEQYTEKPDSRTIIFVSTRTCAQNISKYLSEYLSKRDDLKVFFGQNDCVGYMTSIEKIFIVHSLFIYFLGSNQSISLGGQSAVIQRQMRDSFKNGRKKILAVTSVSFNFFIVFF